MWKLRGWSLAASGLQVVFLLMWSTVVGAEPAEPALRWQVEPISKQLKQDWKLAPFYKKHVSVDGFPILASERVSDHALLEAAYLIERMVDKRPDLLRALVQNKTRFVVMGVTELTTQVPEHSDLKPNRFFGIVVPGDWVLRLSARQSVAEKRTCLLYRATLITRRIS